MQYNLEDKPRLLPMILYGLQWWIVTVPALIVMGLVLAKLHFGADLLAQGYYMQKLFAILGLTLLAQIFFGHKLPLVVGPASVLLVGILASLSSGIPAIYTAIMIGGLVMAIMAAAGMLKILQRLFTTRIIVTIMFLIPITLTPTILNLSFKGASNPLFNLGFLLVITILLIVLNRMLNGIWKSTTLIWGILMSSFFLYQFNLNPVNVTTEPGEISNAGYGLFIIPEFEFGVIFSFLFCALAILIAEVGSIQAVGKMIGADQMETRTKRGVFFSGISSAVSGLTGVIGSTDFSLSPGIIAATRCASRYPFIVSGILLILCAFFPPLIQMLLLIPNIVMGVVLLYVMTTQFAAGFQMLVQQKAVIGFNDGVIIGMPLMVALLISFIPGDVIAQIPAMIRPLLGNSLVMGIVMVLLMEHLVLPSENNSGD
ncbi:MAG: purine/pyrimidine permease [Lentimicrobium sp.]|jgi:xanthine/uracil permease|nr:purine/pyrimidine permease [Lentimicrobium sp.]MDD2527717.1 solute carrier family 23 protein [Lentimicrobiaceae bacterium]MDD4597442.1 solute carrier family 23 protein [Lentimicrobiaceae bacterium]MDY0026458.1 solute carrier family 23 protein [Lentimicrobium sp.]